MVALSSGVFPADRSGMDIAAAASSMKDLDLKNSVSVAVARKALDAQKQAGESAVELIRAAAETGAALAETPVRGGRGGLDLEA